MTVLRIALFSGLVLHKVVWEVLKRRGESDETPPERTGNPMLSLIKLLKSLALLFLLIQTLFLEVLPILTEPLPLRLAGVLIYVIGLATAVLGRIQLGDNWANIEDSQILPGQSLVTRGIYGYVRHPIYVGDILLLAGLELALNSWLVLAVLLPATIFIKRALAEEALLERVFPEYETYRSRTKGFIPFVV